MKGPKKSNGGPAKKSGGAPKKKDGFTDAFVKNVSPKSTVILGVSGGPDSMYLLDRCLKLAKQRHVKLVVAHVDHGLRGKASSADCEFVRENCKNNGIPFHTLKINLNKRGAGTSKNLEEAGREARYRYFENLRKRLKAEWTVTAHHLNDNIETMLLNLIRGAHLNGIKGMETASPSRHLLRPMLGITKNEIIGYLHRHRLPYRLDESNENTDFSRNWLRKKIIPLFPKLNANFEQTFKETLHNITQTAQYLEQQCESWLKKNGTELRKKLHMELDAFLHEHPAFQKHLLAHLYKKTHRSTKKLTNKHLEEILDVLRLRRANRKKEFGPSTFLEVVWERQKKNAAKKRYIRLTAKK